MTTKLKAGRNEVWHETGFRHARLYDDIYLFESLNPQVDFRMRLPRRERLTLAWFWFRQAVRRT